MRLFLSRKNFYLVILFYSIFVLLFAIYVEYVLRYEPCKLCLYQRAPYVFAIFISYIGFNYSKNDKILIFMIMIFSLSAIVSGYHFGIEKNLLPELASCSNQNVNILDKSELLKTLDNMPSNCKDVNFKLLGFSLSNINFLSSFLIMVYSIRTLVYEKN